MESHKNYEFESVSAKNQIILTPPITLPTPCTQPKPKRDLSPPCSLMPAAVDLSPLPTASGRGSQHALRSPPTPCAPRGHPNPTSTVVLVHGHGARTRHLRSWQFNRRQRAKIRCLSIPHLKPDLAARFSGTMRTRRVAILCHPAGVTAGRAPRSAATLTEHIDLSNVLVLVF